MIMSLKNMFGEQGLPVRKITLEALMNTKMDEGPPMREHVLKYFDNLNTLEILGGEIDTKSQIDIILESLPDSFNQFKLNYSKNKINFKLIELLNTLYVAEGIIKGYPSINNVEKSLFSKFFPKGKGK